MPSSTAVLHFNLGVALYKEGNADEAIAAYSRAIQADPAFDQPYNNRGWAQFERAQYSDALADFNEAVRLNPNNAVALSNRGAVLSAMRRHDEALADLTRAIAITPENAQSYAGRAGIYVLIGQREKATADLERALALDANCAAAHYHYGLMHAKSGEFAKAYPYLARAVRMGIGVARNAFERVLQELYVRAAKGDSMQQAIESFLDSESEDDLRVLCEQHPYVLLPAFYDTFLGEKYSHVPGLRERALILQEFAHEYGR
jgi:tetratricopeptide (TPR) repeat protein